MTRQEGWIIGENIRIPVLNLSSSDTLVDSKAGRKKKGDGKKMSTQSYSLISKKI